MVFGECGQGKSTTLNEIVEIVSNKYYIGLDHGCKFKSMESFKAVTPCVQMGSVGDMTLFDTPGFNDSDINRSDKSILIETVKTLRSIIQDPKQGISSFIQCIMPNAAQRITEITINAMSLMLFTLNSFDSSTDILNHPRLIVVFNDVSKYGNDYDPLTVDKSLSEQSNNSEMSENLRI